MARNPVTIVTFDWVPDFARGFVRDIRARWAAEETGTPYRIETVPAMQKSDAHRAMQPYQQVPALKDDGLTLFESGAIVLHLAEGTALLPPARRSEVTQWAISALNTVEAASGMWMQLLLQDRMPDWFGPAPGADQIANARKYVDMRLAALQQAMAGRDWLLDDFSAADILMADTLRVIDAEGALADFPDLKAYLARATGRPAFQRALAAHMAHWSAADEARNPPVPA
ncbi:glutathione S-transferase family protein [Paracoccus sp. M683]|uniref:glutathione S-transferase family protein n=1 Tax=Paracoccus sp. M683 TaxID=2594268 RepID=UPI0011814CF3|nr:glutathione S-transferase family protein [Paracoccus sp. M683]TRW98168.1 glutathione S-transferase family protein [Paracoccus sp. M683]